MRKDVQIGRRDFFKVGLAGAVGGLVSGGCKGRELSEEEERRLEESNSFVTGTVLHEDYVSPGFVRVDERHKIGLVSQAYSNPTVTLGKSIYNMKVRMDDDSEVILNVLDGGVPKESVREMFFEGDRIGFTKGNLCVYKDFDNFFLIEGRRVGEDRRESGFYEKGIQYVSREPRHIKKL
jgi:hypothetical protein